MNQELNWESLLESAWLQSQKLEDTYGGLLEAAGASGYTTAYKDELYSLVEQTMTPKLTKEIDQIIIRYLDKNSDILKSVNFSKRLLFPPSLADKINGFFGIDKKRVVEAAKKSDFLDHKWEVSTIPIYSTLTSLIVYHLKNKNERSARLALIFLAMPMYSSVLYRQFPKGVNQEIMDYTIANLPKKFILKQTGTIFGMLTHTAEKTYETYRESILTLDDFECYNKFITGLKTRIGKNIKHIAERYYEHYKNGDYLNTDTDSMEEDDYRIVSSDTLRVSGLARKVVMNIATIGYDRKIVRMARNLSRDVSMNTLNGILDDILQNHKEELNEFIIRCIEILYIKGYSIDDAKLPKFLSVAVEAYRSNSDDPTIQFIKDTLEGWIDMNTSTKHNYKRSVFYTFILTIQKEAKGGDY